MYKQQGTADPSFLAVSIKSKPGRAPSGA